MYKLTQLSHVKLIKIVAKSPYNIAPVCSNIILVDINIIDLVFLFYLRLRCHSEAVLAIISFIFIGK